MTEQNKSPLPKAKKVTEVKQKQLGEVMAGEVQVTMTFAQAMEAVMDGKKMTKLEWKNPELYFLLKDGFLRYHTEKGSFDIWDISEGDLMGKDYVELVVSEGTKPN